jgi:predicted transposase YbfD/YdcC
MLARHDDGLQVGEKAISLPDAPRRLRNERLRSHEEQEHGHGRSETRSVHTILHPEGIRDQSLWQDLQAITMIVSEQQVAGKEASMEVRYYIGSKAMQAAGYARAIRGHWGIENGLHWVLDMSFAEDQSRIRKEHGPENFALLRRLALSLIKRNRQRGSVRGQRLQSGWNEQFLEKVLSGK